MTSFVNLTRQIRIENALFFRDRVVLAFHVCLPIALLVLLTVVHARLWRLQWTVGVAPATGSAIADRIAAGLKQLPGFTVVCGDDVGLRALARSGDVAATIVVGRHDDISIAGRSHMAQLLPLVIRALLADEPHDRRPSPLATDVLESGDNPMMRRFLPGVIGMMVASVALFGFGSRIASFRQRSFLLRLAVTPLGVKQFVLAQAIHRTLFIVAKGGLLAVIGTHLLGLHGHIAILPLAAVLTAGALAFLGIGFLIGGVAPNGESASGVCHALFFPMLLVCGAFYPTTALPEHLAKLSTLLPMTYLLRGLDGALSGGAFAGAIAVLVAWGTGTLWLTALVFSPLPGRGQ
jgi:ABC-2 type transport system permease protein